MYFANVHKYKDARAQVKSLEPTTEFLFGGKVKDLCQDMKASMELNPLSSGGRGRGRGCGGYGGYGGYNPHFSAGGQHYHAKNKFKSKFRGRGGLSKFKDE